MMTMGSREEGRWKMGIRENIETSMRTIGSKEEGQREVGKREEGSVVGYLARPGPKARRIRISNDVQSFIQNFHYA